MGASVSFRDLREGHEETHMLRTTFRIICEGGDNWEVLRREECCGPPGLLEERPGTAAGRWSPGFERAQTLQTAMTLVSADGGSGQRATFESTKGSERATTPSFSQSRAAQRRINT